MENVKIGEYTYHGNGFRVLWNVRQGLRGKHLDPKLTIGKFCSIADNVSIYLGGNHPTKYMTTFSLHAKLHNDWNASWGIHLSSGDVDIGNDVWLGDNVTVMSGVKIGDGAVVGAYSVVRSEILPYSINYGNPCQFIKKRFPEDTEMKLNEMQWWNWPIDKIKEATKLLESENIDELYKFYLMNIKIF